MAFGEHQNTKKAREIIDAVLKEANEKFEECESIRRGRVSKFRKAIRLTESKFIPSEGKAFAANIQEKAGYELLGKKLKEIADAYEEKAKKFRV